MYVDSSGPHTSGELSTFEQRELRSFPFSDRYHHILLRPSRVVKTDGIP